MFILAGMKKITYTFIIILFAVGDFYGQFSTREIREFVNSTSSKRELIEKNTVLLMEGYNFQSIIVIDKLLESEPENSNFNYRKGFALLQNHSDHNLAKPFLEKAILKTNRFYDMFSPREKASPVDSYYYLGKCNHLNNKIDEARKFYREFLDKIDSESSLIKTAELALKQCDVAEEMLENPKNYEVVNVGNKINTEYPDFAPIVSLDGKSLYFTSRRLRKDSSNLYNREPQTDMFLEDVYVSYKDENGNFQEAELMDFCLVYRNEATVYISPDERKVYLYQDDIGNGDIFYTEYKDDGFDDIKPIDIKGVNTDSWEPHITVTQDGGTKYFVSDRPGGYGGRDIYRVVKLPNGEWSKPQNLGPTINTEHDEDAPFIAVDNKTLYFSSNGEKSMGGFDVFLSIIDEDMNWSEPFNLGSPLNTTGDDIYYTTTADGLTGYLSSFRPGGEGEKDIYEIKNDYLGIDNSTIIAGEIDADKNQDLPSDIVIKLVCLDCDDKEVKIIRPRLGDNSYTALVDDGKTYEMTYYYGEPEKELFAEKFTVEPNKKGEISDIEKYIKIDVPTMTVTATEKVEEIAEETKVEKVIDFPPLKFDHNFGYNKNEIDPKKGKLKEFLDSVQAQIDNGRTEFTIKVNSSASKVTTRTFKNNQLLAETRANNLKKILENHFNNREAIVVHVVINEVKVDGPKYTPGDHVNIDKYYPYQFVNATLEGASVTRIVTE